MSVIGRLFRQKRVQNCLILTEDGRIVTTELAVEKGYIVDHKTMEAWGLFPDSCVKRRGTAEVYQVMSERDSAPIPLDGAGTPKLTEEIISKIAEEHADEALANVVKKSLKNKMADTLRTVILIFAVLVALMVVFGLVTTGKLKMPSF